MQRFLELLLGLDGGFLAREGGLSLRFRPRWPMQETFGAGGWNLLLIAAAVALVVWIYRHEGKTRPWRIGLGALRLGLLLLVIGLLNRPTLTLSKERVEPSVLAVLVDDSASMSVQDVPVDDEDGAEDETISRLTAATQVATPNSQISNSLAEQHELRRFHFSDAAEATTPEQLADLEPAGSATNVTGSVAEVLRELRGQNLAGVLLLTDGRDTAGGPNAEAQQLVRSAGVPIYPVPVGGAGEPSNVRIEAVAAESIVFAGDVLNVTARLRAVGFDGATEVTARLVDAEGAPLLSPDGEPITTTATLSNDEASEIELLFETQQPESLDLAVVVEAPAGVREINLDDNKRPLRVDVLEADISVLYVEGYPRWEYRYLKNRLIRDATIDSSILLTSADPTFAQEGNTPIQRFPVSLEELLAYDVVLFGDVSPQQFSDGQLELLREYVGDAGGGFGMIAGPRNSPWSWVGTPIEALLPIDVVSEPSQGNSTLTIGWRPDVTEAGERTGIFRFYADPEANAAYLENDLQELFWYADGVRPKAGVGDVLARHPDETGPDGRPAPLLVAGRYGAGRTLFNGMDSSWRWRYYTGEHVFDTFWIQQIRYLARGRKIGERRATLDVNRPAYNLGEQVTAELGLLDPQLARQLPDRIDAELRDAEGQPVRTVPLVRRQDAAGEGDRFTGTFAADRAGAYTLIVPPLAADVPALAANVNVEIPRAELDRPAVDRAALTRLANDTGGEVVPLSSISQLAELIPSVEKRVPVITDRALWDSPLALILVALLLTTEWVGRKVAGMI